LREAQSVPLNDTAAWAAAPETVPVAGSGIGPVARAVAQVSSAVRKDIGQEELRTREEEARLDSARQALSVLMGRPEAARPVVRKEPMLPEMVGTSESMRELARLIRLVAPRTTSVLIEGETGTGKEVVARALHRLSERSSKPFVVLNCAAIPEALLEAELFGHTRGAFTGAVQSRTGRIEAAHGGTLFLDEIGEMPMALQAKMLRFLECGELQRVGDNETMRVDVRVIAATHQPLEKLASSVGAERTFRLDLYHRLAVFPVEVPALRERMEDLELLTEHFLEQMGQQMPRKRLTTEALLKLREHSWPGNVRELMHVLERGAILAAERMEIGAAEIRIRRATRG
jgi:transcriptional regulator with GAF, ATPase, and Fis domain